MKYTCTNYIFDNKIDACVFGPVTIPTCALILEHHINKDQSIISTVVRGLSQPTEVKNIDNSTQKDLINSKPTPAPKPTKKSSSSGTPKTPGNCNCDV